jgi:hypothetical protein
MAPSTLVVGADTAAQIRSVLRRDDIIGFEALAIAGEPLGWFVGGSRGLSGNFVVVVVLEGSASSEAAQIGERLLESVQATSIP